MLTQRQPGTTEPSLGHLVSELAREVSDLVRQEIALAKSEMADKVNELRRDVVMAGAAAVLLAAGFLVLLGAIVGGLVVAGWPVWLAALVVAVVAMGIGLAMLGSVLARLKSLTLAPQQTLATLKEDAQWAKSQIQG